MTMTYERYTLEQIEDNIYNSVLVRIGLDYYNVFNVEENTILLYQIEDSIVHYYSMTIEELYNKQENEQVILYSATPISTVDEEY